MSPFDTWHEGSDIRESWSQRLVWAEVGRGAPPVRLRTQLRGLGSDGCAPHLPHGGRGRRTAKARSHRAASSSVRLLSPFPAQRFTRRCPITAPGRGLSAPSCTRLKGPLCEHPFLGAVGVWRAPLCSHSLRGGVSWSCRRLSQGSCSPCPSGQLPLSCMAPPPSALERATARLLCLFGGLIKSRHLPTRPCCTHPAAGQAQPPSPRSFGVPGAWGGGGAPAGSHGSWPPR